MYLSIDDATIANAYRIPFGARLPQMHAAVGVQAAIRRVKTAITASIIDASKHQLMAYVEANACPSYKSMPYNAGAP